MPSRRSDRGRALAQALRDDPNFNKAKIAADFTEPYGTISAAKTIFEGNAGPLDYAAAIPVLGGVARAAKRTKKVVGVFDDAAPAFKKMPETPEVGDYLYDELFFLSDDMNVDEFMEAASDGASSLSPEAKRLIRALDKDDWLGFDNPSQALHAITREGVDGYEVSSGLKSALGAYTNKAGGYK